MRWNSTLEATVGFGRFGRLGHVIGDIATVQFEKPQFIRLQADCIHQLSVTVKDDRGQNY